MSIVFFFSAQWIVRVRVEQDSAGCQSADQETGGELDLCEDQTDADENHSEGQAA